MILFRVGTVLAVLVLCACSPNLGSNDQSEKEIQLPDEDLATFALQTDQTSYLAKPTSSFFYGFELTVTLENRTNTTLYLDLCYPDDTSPMYDIALAASTKGKSAWNPSWGCVGHNENIILEPGKSRTDTYFLEGPTTFENGQPLDEMEGIFRFRYRTRDCPANEQCEASFTVSNAFKITLSP